MPGWYHGLAARLVKLGVPGILLLGSASGQVPKGPPGYTFCANADAAFNLPGPSHVAYGSEGRFVYKYNQVGTVRFDFATFGDPVVGGNKYGFYRPVGLYQSPQELSAALKKIKGHLDGSMPLSPSQMNDLGRMIRDKIHLIGMDEPILRQAFDIVDQYETQKGPIFIEASTRDGFPNTPEAADGFELARVLFAIQQGLHDEAFNFEKLPKYHSLLEGRKFRTADYFPGPCAPPADPAAAYTVKINGFMPPEWGRPTKYSSKPSRKPTGYYLAPGSVATVTVPASMVGRDFEILVGAHTWDKFDKTPVKRFFRVSQNYPITRTVTRIANPFGGGIYIVVPYKADLGIVDVQLRNVVPAPYFSTQGFDRTTRQQWLANRMSPGPWADFVSDKFMMQVPRSWIHAFSEPATLMRDWDKAMDGFSELLGYPLIRNNHVLYLQPDVSIGHRTFGIGYPQVNNPYNPHSEESGNKDHWLLLPARNSTWPEFHEAGHAHLISGFPDEGESIVHLPYVYIFHSKFGLPLDTAFSRSCPGENGIWSRALTAQYWMTRDNFRTGNNMTPEKEMNYEHTGHAKYVEIADLFGWEALKSAYYQENVDYMAKIPRDGLTDADSRILRLSKAAGVDLTPLIHFWGRRPENATQLKAAITAANLHPSVKIHDRLELYRSLILKNGHELKAFITANYPTGSGRTDGTWGYTWLQNLAAEYDDSYAQASRKALQSLFEAYFPGGRPTHETTPPAPNRAAFAAPPRADGPTSVIMTAVTGSDASGPVQYLFTETSGQPGATSSAWQNSPTYRDTGLTPGLTYTYTVTLRDVFANKGNPSEPSGAANSGTGIKPASHGAPRVRIGPGSIELGIPGPHTVRLYSLSGKLIWSIAGLGPARYPVDSRLSRGVRIIQVVTEKQEIRQVLPAL